MKDGKVQRVDREARGRDREGDTNHRGGSPRVVQARWQLVLVVALGLLAVALGLLVATLG